MIGAIVRDIIGSVYERNRIKGERFELFNPVPFGFEHERSVRFKEQMKQGDELWKFSSSAESWQHLAGRTGLCIVRNGEIIDSVVTMMN